MKHVKVAGIAVVFLLGMTHCSKKTSPTAGNNPQDASQTVASGPQDIKSSDKGETEPSEVESKSARSVEWLSITEAVEKSKTEKRPVFIDVYTDWCGWCKVMDKNTFNDPKIAQLLNEKFYAVKFNGEQREAIAFKGTTYKYVASGNSGYHELAAALLNNKMSYPTVVFLDEEFRMVQPLPGYRQAPEFHMIAQFFGEGHYKNTKWEEWQHQYKSPY